MNCPTHDIESVICVNPETKVSESWDLENFGVGARLKQRETREPLYIILEENAYFAK